MGLNILYKSLPIWLRSIIVKTRLANQYTNDNDVGDGGTPFDCTLYMPTSNEIVQLTKDKILGPDYRSNNITGARVLYYNTPVKGNRYIEYGTNPVGDNQGVPD